MGFLKKINRNVIHYNSCDAILSKWPNSPSGYYSLVDVNGHTCHVYCHMENLCGKGGGWRRIASLNMTDSNETCPTQFRLIVFIRWSSCLWLASH